MFGRPKIAAIMAEFLGGATLTIIYLAVSRSPVGIAWFIAASVGFAAALVVLKFGGVSGGHANPALTFGLWTVRKITTTRAIVYIASQLLGGLAAAALFRYLSNQPLTSIADKHFVWRVFIAEAVGAFVFCFGVASAVYQNHVGARLAATVGGGLVLGILVASVAGNGLINPAIAVGAKSINVAYLAGPALGGLLGMNFYALVFAPTGTLRLSARIPARATVTKPTISKNKKSSTRRK